MTGEALAAHSFLNGLAAEQLERLSGIASQVRFAPENQSSVNAMWPMDFTSCAKAA